MEMKNRFGDMRQRAQDAGRSAVNSGKDRTGAAAGYAKDRTGAAAGYAKDKSGAAVSLVGDATSSFRAPEVEDLLGRLPLPDSPVAEPWRWSLANMITAGEKPPKGTGLLLKQLDRFGMIDIGPGEVGFDGDTAKWGKVKSIRTRTLDGIIEQATTDTVVDGIASVLPPVPGRGWVAGKATGMIFTLWAMVAELALKNPEAGNRQIVCEIEYKGWIRTKESSTGFCTGPIMTLLPQLDSVFRQEAQRYGVPIEPARSTSVETAEQRTEWLRRKQAAILAKREEAHKEIES